MLPGILLWMRPSFYSLSIAESRALWWTCEYRSSICWMICCTRLFWGSRSALITFVSLISNDWAAFMCVFWCSSGLSCLAYLDWIL